MLHVLPFLELIMIDGPWPLSSSWKEVPQHFEGKVGNRVGPTSNLGLLPGQGMCRVEPGLPMSPKGQRPWNLAPGAVVTHSTAHPAAALAPACFWFSRVFDPWLVSLFCLVPCSCPLHFLSDFPPYIHWWLEFGPLLSLPAQEASSILICSPILDPKCWHECTWTDASPWPTSLDLVTNRD